MNKNIIILFVGLLLLYGTHYYQGSNNNFNMALVVSGYLAGAAFVLFGLVKSFKRK